MLFFPYFVATIFSFKKKTPAKKKKRVGAEGMNAASMLYTDPASSSGLADLSDRADRADVRFGKPRSYHASVSTEIVTLITFVVSSVLLLCAASTASAASTDQTDQTDQTDTTSAVVAFTDLLARAFELARYVSSERTGASMRAETNTYKMPEATGAAEPEFYTQAYHALVGNAVHESTRERTEYKVMCCLVAVYAKMVDPGNAGLNDHAGLFGLLASDVCRGLLLGTHKGTETKTSVVAMHWYFRGKHDIFAEAKSHITRGAIGDEKDGENETRERRELEALIAESTSFLSGAFSVATAAT